MSGQTMNRNRQQIWDTLLEDALKAPTLAPLPVGRRVPTRPRRRAWAGVAVTVACLLLIAGALGFAFTRPPANEPGGDAGTTAEGTNETRQPSPPGPGVPGDNSPQADERASNPDNSATKPGHTPDSPGQPAPQPGSDDTQPPKPEPDRTPTPTPEPKPDDVVEDPTPKPEPDESGKTAPVPDKPAPRITLLRAERNAKLRTASPGTRDFNDAGEATDFGAAVFSCDKPVDLLVAGVLIRLMGELSIQPGETLKLALADNDAYIDSRGANTPVQLTVESHVLTFATGAVLAEEGANADSITVFDGDVRLGEEAIPAGKQATLRKRGLVSMMDHAGMAGIALLRGLNDRAMYREDFDDPKGRLREGVIEGGVLRGDSVFWGYPANIPFQPGMVLRLRVKLAAGQHTITQFCEERNDNYSTTVQAADGWQVIEISFDSLRDRTTHQQAPRAGESFMNLSIASKVEIDWVEILKPHQ